MASTLYNQYINYPLADLVHKLEGDYYDVLAGLCNNAYDHAISLDDNGQHSETSLYVSMATKMLNEIKSLIVFRRNVMIPYIDDLDHKVDEGHDCGNCSGNCGAKHEIHMSELKNSHKKIKELLFRLQMVAVPLYSTVKYPEEYKILRNEVTLIDTILTELFYLEESALVPKVLNAQKTINA